jgi:hypothetical protein
MSILSYAQSDSRPFVPPPSGSNTSFYITIPSDGISLEDAQGLANLSRQLNSWLSENPMLFAGVFLGVVCLTPLVGIFLFFRRNIVLSLIGTVFLAPFGGFLSLNIIYWTSGGIAQDIGMSLAAFHPDAPVFMTPVISIPEAIWRGALGGFLPLILLIIGGVILLKIARGDVVGKTIVGWSDGTQTIHDIIINDSPSLKGCVGVLFGFIPMLIWLTPLVAILYSVIQYAYEAGLRAPIYAGREYFISSLVIETLGFSIIIVLGLGMLKNALYFLLKRR